MNQDRIDAERADMERRVAHFREMQTKFQREREAYYEKTIERVRALESTPPERRGTGSRARPGWLLPDHTST
jgi:hypothetical protein